MRVSLMIGLLLGLSGCAGLDKAITGSNPVPSSEQRQEIVKQFDGLSDSEKHKFINGEPWIGMSVDALQSMWGNEPSRTQKKLTDKGSEEIQLYHVRIGDWKSGIRSKYYKVNVIEGKVSELQEMDEDIGTYDKI